MSLYGHTNPQDVPGAAPEDPFSEYNSPEPPKYTATPNFSRPFPRQSNVHISRSSPVVRTPPPPPPSLPPVAASSSTALKRAYSTNSRRLPSSPAPGPSTPPLKNYAFSRISTCLPAHTFANHEIHASPSSSTTRSSPRWAESVFGDDVTVRPSSPAWTFDVDEKETAPPAKSLSTSSLRSMASLEVFLQVVCGCLGFMNTV